MRRTSSSILTLLLCCGLAFTASGCGKKSATGATTTTAEATTTAAETTTAATTTAEATTTEATTTEAVTTVSTTSGAVANGLGALASVANCGELAGLGATLGQAFSGVGADQIAKSEELLQQFADKAPSDIRPDFETLANAIKDIVDALKGVDLSSGKTPPPDVLAKVLTLVSDPKLATAETNITAWATKNCKSTK